MHSKSIMPPQHLVPLLASLVLAPAVFGQTWNGAGTDDFWSNNANWTTNAPANNGTAVVNFDGVTRLTPDVDSNWSVTRLVFLAGAGAFDVGGSNTLTLTSGSGTTSGGIVNQSALTQTVSTNLAFAPSSGTNVTVFANTADLIIAGDIDGGANRSIFNGTSGRSITITGSISGSGSNLGSVNSGIAGFTLTLAGNNSYTGRTDVLRGTLEIAHASALGDTAFISLGAANNNNTDTNSAYLLTTGAYTAAPDITLLSTANFGTAITIGGSTAHASEFSGDITLGTASNQGRALRVVAADGGQVTFSGDLINYGTDGGDAVLKTGLGTVILSGTGNTYSGTTTISEGTLLFNGAFVDAGGAFSVAQNATLGGIGTIDRAINIAEGARLLAGQGEAAGTLQINADVSFSNGSIITFVLGASDTHSSLARLGGTWTFDANQTLEVTGVAMGLYSDIITGLDTNSINQSVVDSWIVTGLDEGLQAALIFNAGNLDLNVTVIPEPSSTVALLALFVLCATATRRNRR